MAVEGAPRRTFILKFQTEKIHCRLREVTKRSTGHTEPRSLVWNQFLCRPGYSPTGMLRFSFDYPFSKDSGIRRDWHETRSRSMEALVPKILQAVALAGPELLKQRELREEERRRSAQLAQIERNERSLRRLEDVRWRTLVMLAQQRDTIAITSRLIDELERKMIDPTDPVGDRSGAEWIAWARQMLDAYDPLNGGPKMLLSRLAKLREWDDPDNLRAWGDLDDK